MALPTARSCQGGTAAYFGEANRFPAWAHGMVEIPGKLGGGKLQYPPSMSLRISR